MKRIPRKRVPFAGRERKSLPETLSVSAATRNTGISMERKTSCLNPSVESSGIWDLYNESIYGLPKAKSSRSPEPGQHVEQNHVVDDST